MNSCNLKATCIAIYKPKHGKCKSILLVAEDYCIYKWLLEAGKTNDLRGFSFQVNGVKFPLKEVGLLAIVIDACVGKVTKETFFPEEKIKLVENYIKTGIPQR